MTYSSEISSRQPDWYTRGYLPHFDGGATPQVVTFRLIDSFPTVRLQEWEAELAAMQPIQAQQERRRRIEEYLDKGFGEAWLSRPEVAKVVSQTLLSFKGCRYKLHAWCVMPNHVHVLLTPQTDLHRILHSWKSFSANKANALIGRCGPLWQREYFDRFIRDEKHFIATVAYIENNPVKAGLCQIPQDWRYSSAFRTHIP